MAFKYRCHHHHLAFEFGFQLLLSMSHSPPSLRFGDVICLGLQFTGGCAIEKGMFYVLGHRSPLSLVEGCQDVIDHVLVAEMPKTFASSHVKFPVPVHSREYWFEIVGKSEYMIEKMLQKFRMQLERLEAEVEQTSQLEELSNLATPHHSTERLRSSASGSDLVPAMQSHRNLARVSHHPKDIELSEINVAVLENQATTCHGAEASKASKSAHSLKEISRLKKRIADLIDLATGEAQRNLENEISRQGSVVRYGDVIQLRHVLSKAFVALASSSLSSYELSSGDMNCWFAFEPVLFLISWFMCELSFNTDVAGFQALWCWRCHQPGCRGQTVRQVGISQRAN
jgi:hypothetical protein